MPVAQGQNMTLRAYFTASKQGKTGLTVTVDVYAPDGGSVVTGASATEIGGGIYEYTFSTSGILTGNYSAVFKTSDATVDVQHVPANDQAWAYMPGAAPTVPSAEAISDAVWDELLAGHVVAGSAGKALSDILTRVLVLLGPGDTLRYIALQSPAGDPIVGAEVWLTTDSADPDDVICRPIGGTKDDGRAAVMIFLGVDYYLWINHPDWEGTNPTKVRWDS